jgi:hypothetical protein
MFGVFRVKNHDFTPKNHIFSDFRGGAPPPPIHCWGGYPVLKYTCSQILLHHDYLIITVDYLSYRTISRIWEDNVRMC